jgi:hypothetical protein
MLPLLWGNRMLPQSACKFRRSRPTAGQRKPWRGHSHAPFLWVQVCASRHMRTQRHWGSGGVRRSLELGPGLARPRRMLWHSEARARRRAAGLPRERVLARARARLEAWPASATSTCSSCSAGAGDPAGGLLATIFRMWRRGEGEGSGGRGWRAGNNRAAACGPSALGRRPAARPRASRRDAAGRPRARARPLARRACAPNAVSALEGSPDTRTSRDSTAISARMSRARPPPLALAYHGASPRCEKRSGADSPSRVTAALRARAGGWVGGWVGGVVLVRWGCRARGRPARGRQWHGVTRTAICERPNARAGPCPTRLPLPVWATLVRATSSTSSGAKPLAAMTTRSPIRAGSRGPGRGGWRCRATAPRRWTSRRLGCHTSTPLPHARLAWAPRHSQSAHPGPS